MTDIKSTFLKIWIEIIKERYSLGLICSERHLQCELYHLLRAHTNYDVWIEPTIEVASDSGIRKIKPDLLVSERNSIIAIIEIKNVPDGEARYKEDVQKLVLFEKSSDSVYFLHLDSSTGRYKKEKDNELRLSKDILCVYAAISKGNFAHSVKSSEFWVSQNPDIIIPENFLHLVGRLYANGRSQFCEASIEESSNT